MKNKKIIVVAIICIILVSIGVAQKKVETDTFYTIKIGEYISENGIGNLTEDPFSWHELPYTFPHWLYDFTMYGIYCIAGWNSIYASTIIFTAILGILIFALGYKKSKNEIISCILTIALLCAVSNFWVARAQLISYSIFILEIFFIEKFLETKNKRYAIVYSFNNKLGYELEEDSNKYEKLFPVTEEDIQQNNTFSVYKIHYDEEEGE